MSAVSPDCSRTAKNWPARQIYQCRPACSWTAPHTTENQSTSASQHITAQAIRAQLNAREAGEVARVPDEMWLRATRMASCSCCSAGENVNMFRAQHDLQRPAGFQHCLTCVIAGKISQNGL